MNETLTQVIIFFAVTLIGAVTRLLYIPAAAAQKRVKNGFFSATVDVLIAVLGAAGMMLVCFLLAGNVRIFYALFFIGGMAVMHYILKKFEKNPEKKARTGGGLSLLKKIGKKIGKTDKKAT